MVTWRKMNLNKYLEIYWYDDITKRIGTYCGHEMLYFTWEDYDLCHYWAFGNNDCDCNRAPYFNLGKRECGDNITIIDFRIDGVSYGGF